MLTYLLNGDPSARKLAVVGIVSFLENQGFSSPDRDGFLVLRAILNETPIDAARVDSWFASAFKRK